MADEQNQDQPDSNIDETLIELPESQDADQPTAVAAETVLSISSQQIAEAKGASEEAKPQGRQTVDWLQFPRRVVLLIIAYVLARGLLVAFAATTGFSAALESGPPAIEMLAERLPNTLALLLLALVFAGLLAALTALVALFVDRLQENQGAFAAIAKVIGRLFVFGQASAPVFWLAFMFILISVGLRNAGLPSLPLSGAESSGGGLVDRLTHLILPAFTLALLPAALTARTTAQAVIQARTSSDKSGWLIGLFRFLAALFAQIGGLLSVGLLVETVFMYPGLGRMAIDSVFRLDIRAGYQILVVYAGIVLVGRVLAEFFRWLERLSLPAWQTPPTASSPSAQKFRRIWLIFGLLLLLIPLLNAASGLVVSEDATQQINAADILAGPSAEYPLGTDNLGRDLSARVRRAAFTGLGMAAAAAVFLLLFAIPGGALAGYLTKRGTLLMESLADVLLLPADALSLLPIIPALITLNLLLGLELGGVVLLLIVLLAARAVKSYKALWLTTPEDDNRFVKFIKRASALFLSGLFFMLIILESLNYLGLGLRPPLPTLGGMLSEYQRFLLLDSPLNLISGVVLWACAFAFIIAAGALINFFNTRDVLLHLNE